MKQLSTEFLTQVDALIEHIKADYAAWTNPDPADPVMFAIKKENIQKFNAGVTFQVGSKYLKIVKRGSVHSFIVVKPDAKFKVGDILKAASWATPARNFPRGNVVSGDFEAVSWTGA